MSDFELKEVVFCCNWCSYAGADLSGTSSEALKFQSTVNGFIDKVMELGPLALDKKVRSN